MLTHRRGWRFDVPDAAQGTVQVFERRLGRRLPHSGASDTVELYTFEAEVHARAWVGDRWFDLDGDLSRADEARTLVTPVPSRPVRVEASGDPALGNEGLVLVLDPYPVNVDLGATLLNVPLSVERMFLRRYAGMAWADGEPEVIPMGDSPVVRLTAPMKPPFVPVTNEHVLAQLDRAYGPAVAAELFERLPGWLRNPGAPAAVHPPLVATDGRVAPRK